MQYIHLLKTYQDCMSDLLKTMQTLAESIEIYHLLRTIPGVGPLTAAMLIAEIGDIKRFPSVKQLAAFAGLDSAVHESGTFKSKKNRISKRGSQYLIDSLRAPAVSDISKKAPVTDRDRSGRSIPFSRVVVGFIIRNGATGQRE
ncbi:MAG: transposase [Bacillota bacterium]